MNDRELTAAGVVPATGWLNLDLGGPTANKIWTPRLVSGPVAADLVTPLVGTAVLIVGEVPRSTDAASPGDVRDWTDVFPNIGPWARGQIYVQSPEHLGVAFLGTPVGQTVVVTIGIEEWPSTAAWIREAV